MVEDSRGISICTVLSKIFEHCILDRFSGFLATSENEFDFTKCLSCSHAIYSIRSVIDEYVAGGSTVNVYALDLSKAFDRINHFALFIKLMNSLRSTFWLLLRNGLPSQSPALSGVIECQILLIWCQKFDKVVYYPHHYSLYM